MYCYKDKTFCTYYRKCNNGNKCKIALNNKIKALNIPIAIYTSKPECFKEIEIAEIIDEDNKNEGENDETS